MPDPTTGDLRKAVTITDDETGAASLIITGATFLDRRPLTAKCVEIRGAIVSDCGRARSSLPVGASADPEAKPGWRRTMVRTAILMARPEKA